MDPDRPLHLPSDLARPSEFTAEHRAAAHEKLFADLAENGVAKKGANGVEEEKEEGELEEEANVENLIFGVKAIDQNALERGIAAQAEKAIVEKENELDQKRLEKSLDEKEKLEYQLDRLKTKSKNPRTSRKERTELKEQLQDLQEIIATLDSDIADITSRIDARSKGLPEGSKTAPLLSAAAQQHAYETEREFLIRTGKITPFSQLPGLEKAKSNRKDSAYGHIAGPSMASNKGMSHQNLRAPGFRAAEKGEGSKSTKKRRSKRSIDSDEEASESDSPPKRNRSKRNNGEEEDHPPRKQKGRKKRASTSEGEDFAPKEATGKRKRRESAESAGSFVDSEFSEEYMVGAPKKRKKASNRLDAGPLDDGNENYYQARLKEWVMARKEARLEFQGSQHEDNQVDDNEDKQEWYKPHPTEPDAEFTGGFKIPGDIFPSLFDYQKSGVQWLWELHCQNAGGILSDEMGLGKTIQIIAFIAGLHYSKKLDKPVLVVAPATVLKQWVKEFHSWWPPLRVAILHSSGSGMTGGGEYSDEEVITKKGKSGAKVVVERAFKKGHVLVTTYNGLKTYADILSGKEWEYAILDEGHYIRNPDAEATLNCKRLKTYHRIILSGTPVQNNLTELWSLFDFVYPGRLGVLPVFNANFALPIKQGGYKGASNFAVNTAQKCTLVLRELIGPYLLRRTKADVAADLPRKTEQVLFCKLTKYQRDKYVEFLRSDEFRSILNKSKNLLFGLDIVRKICNHPDLLEQDVLIGKPGYNYGEGKYSGKMQITKSLLQLWKKEGHRTLLFCQTVQMLDIMEKYIASFPEGFRYQRMDGKTSIAQRQALVDEFNKNNELDVFLLTTRVGGLGVNLTGADRVIIFDPDWNPSTDMQARERAWRLGQKRPVTIFRLLTAGTIEEKVYQRQIFKQHLASKVLTDPNQARFFEADDLHDLFVLGTSSLSGGTATGDLFRGSERVLDNSHHWNETSKEDAKEDSAIGSIDGVARVEKEGIQDPETESNELTEDQRLLEGILGNAGVLSALEHDTVMNAAGSSDSMADREAKKFAHKMAKDAAKALRDSIAITKTAQIGTVTWTGKSGTVGRDRGDEDAPPPISRSRSISTARNSRGNGNTPSSASRGHSRTPVTPAPAQARGIEDLSPESLNMLVGLRRFFVSRQGEANAGELEAACREMTKGNRARKELWQEMLREVAYTEGRDGARIWRLRRDYGGAVFGFS
ncbi:DNA repair protein rhp26 [Rhizina undulata]